MNTSKHKAGLKTHLWWDDAFHAAFQVAFKDMRFGQFFVPMGRQPDLGQRPTFTEDEVGVKHCPGVWSKLWELSATPGRRQEHTIKSCKWTSKVTRMIFLCKLIYKQPILDKIIKNSFIFAVSIAHLIWVIDKIAFKALPAFTPILKHEEIKPKHNSTAPKPRTIPLKYS